MVAVVAGGVLCEDGRYVEVVAEDREEQVFDQRLNVTEEVLKRLDKNLPNVKIDFKNPKNK